MRNLAKSHFKILFLYLLVVTVLRAEIPGNFGMFFDLLGFWLGGVIGTLLLDLDRLIHIYVERPEEQLSQQVKELVRKQQWKEAAGTLILRRREQYNLAFRNVIFAAVFIPVVFFAFTSAARLFGKGLAAGVMVHFLYDAWRDYLKDKERFRSWFMWMVQRDVPLREQKLLLYVLTGIFAFLTFLLL